MQYVVWLDEPAAGLPPERVGAKTSRLADLLRAGVRVPYGFAVARDAYWEYFDQHSVSSIVRHAVRAAASGLDDPNDAARQIQEVVHSTPMPTEIATQISDAYEQLSARSRSTEAAVAVRSSTIGEDGSVMSFAGAFDSFLGVSGGEAVVSAVKACWASLFGARAIAYRLDRQVSHEDTPMAVCVLELVVPVASGVAVSVQPVTGADDRIVIESSWGWGEAVVQGMVDPDRFEVQKEGGSVLQRVVGHKTVMSAYDLDAGRVSTAPMPQSLMDRPSLNDGEVAAVAAQVLRIERMYRCPVDVEWAVERDGHRDESIRILQARPISGLAATRPADEVELGVRNRRAD
jgi:pyruvate,water dikinase